MATFQKFLRALLTTFYIWVAVYVLLMGFIVITVWANVSLPFTSYNINMKVIQSHSNLRSVRTILGTYYLDHGVLPPDSSWWGALTTPVSYASGLMMDPMSKNDQAVQFVTVGTSFTIYSVGPNRRLDLSPSKILRGGNDAIVLHTYDATNGTRSSGDVVDSGAFKR